MRRFLRALGYWRRVHGGHVDGLEAVRPANGWYTRNRTDLPYPAR